VPRWLRTIAGERVQRLNAGFSLDRST
jgi:hypothetical protein